MKTTSFSSKGLFKDTFSFRFEGDPKEPSNSRKFVAQLSFGLTIPVSAIETIVTSIFMYILTPLALWNKTKHVHEILSIRTLKAGKTLLRSNECFFKNFFVKNNFYDREYNIPPKSSKTLQDLLDKKKNSLKFAGHIVYRLSNFMLSMVAYVEFISSIAFAILLSPLSCFTKTRRFYMDHLSSRVRVLPITASRALIHTFQIPKS